MSEIDKIIIGDATIYTGDCLDVLPTLDADSIQCVVTSPPYWGLRDYGVPGIGLEPTFQDWLDAMVAVMGEVRRVLRPDGTVWLNCGDAYSSRDRAKYDSDKNKGHRVQNNMPRPKTPDGLKPKDLLLMPARLAIALQEDGWWIRSEIIWEKKNPMPESVTDRPTSSHEKVFLLTKSAKYFYDADAIREGYSDATIERLSQPAFDSQKGGPKDPKSGNRSRRKALENLKGSWDKAADKDRGELVQRGRGKTGPATTHESGRNSRDVWSIATEPLPNQGTNFEDCDYVGGDGKPYTASQDCPLHGPLWNRRNQQREQGGEQLSHQYLRNLDSDCHRVLKQAYASVAIASTNNEELPEEISQLHTPESSRANKKQISPHPSEDDRDAAAETSPHTNHTLNQSKHLPGNLDCFPPNNSGTAIDRNKQKSKKGRDPETSQPCNASDEKTLRIGDRQAELLLADSAGHISENNISQDDLSVHPSVQTSSRISGKSSQINYKCNCHISQYSHFAAFPSELVRRCIAAGTSEHGCCSGCGKAWARVVEKGELIKVSESGNKAPALSGKDLMDTGTKAQGLTVGGHVSGYSRETTTLGFCPACDCNLDPIPCTVLDPFSGSGTTGLVALKLGRKYIGIELNQEYVEMSIKRIEQEARQTRMF